MEEWRFPVPRGLGLALDEGPSRGVNKTKNKNKKTTLPKFGDLAAWRLRVVGRFWVGRRQGQQVSGRRSTRGTREAAASTIGYRISIIGYGLLLLSHRDSGGTDIDYDLLLSSHRDSGGVETSAGLETTAATTTT